MRARMIPMVVLPLLLNSPSIGAEGPVSECLERYSNADVGPCLEDAVDTAELRLRHATENLALVLKKLDGRELPRIKAVDKLKSAHGEWQEYRDKECAFTASVTMWGGSGTPNAIVECVVDLTQLRVAQIESMTNRIDQAYRKQ